MTTKMFGRMSAAAVAILAVAGSARAQEAYSNPVGFTTMNVPGTANSAGDVFVFTAVSIVKENEFTGPVLGAAAATLTIQADPAWTDDQFNDPNGDFYVEVLDRPTGAPQSGYKPGSMFNIVDTDLTTSPGNAILTLNTSGADLSTDGVLSLNYDGNGTGDKVRVRMHFTIADVFGADNKAGLDPNQNPAGLPAGPSPGATADQVLIWDPSKGGGAGGYETYYYQTAGGPFTSGWRLSGDPFTDRSDALIYPDQALVIKRLKTNNSAPLRYVNAGDVKLGSTLCVVGSGFTFVGNVYPVAVTLGQSGLYTGDPNTGLTPGPNPGATADQVLIWDPTLGNGLGGFKTYYYQTAGGPFAAGWRLSGDPLTDQAAVQLGGNVAYLIKRGGSAFEWTQSQPFTLP